MFLVSTYRGEIKHDSGEMLKFSILDYPGNVSYRLCSKGFRPVLYNILGFGSIVLNWTLYSRM